jgi:hypothetical protein
MNTLDASPIRSIIARGSDQLRPRSVDTEVKRSPSSSQLVKRTEPVSGVTMRHSVRSVDPAGRAASATNAAQVTATMAGLHRIHTLELPRRVIASLLMG